MRALQLPLAAYLLLLPLGGCGEAPATHALGDGGSGATSMSSIALLHEGAIARTCALNDGVCHSSREYPDLHTLANLVDAIGQPCNVNARHHADVSDTCEGEGDRLVIPSLGVDVEIGTADAVPGDAQTSAELDAVVLHAVTQLPAGAIGATADDAVLRRGPVTFPLGVPATLLGIGDVRLDLDGADPAVKAFLDDRRYPWDETMLRVADVNGNGVLGRTRATALITPGDPMRSYLILRLIDAGEGDLMPRQCRTWDQQATRTLGCWIRGLRVDESGHVTNAYDPIDPACDFDPGDRGRCLTPTGGEGAEAQGIFNRTCGGSHCHVGEAQPAAGLDLSPGRARASLVNVPSVEIEEPRVAPGAPDGSYLLCKLDPACARRRLAAMPLDAAPLSTADLATLRAWIVAGAP